MTTQIPTLHAFLTRILPGPLKALATRFDRSPIDSREGLAAFVRSRSAYVAQTSLYGYLKTRMGTQYARLFQDEVFVAAINAAKWPIFSACLADLTVYACARVAADANLDAEGAAALAQAVFERAAETGFEGAAMAAVGRPAIGDFAARAALTDWRAASEGAIAFSRSPQALVDHAPVSEEFRQLDADIVRNSVRFRWADVQRQLRKRLVAPALVADWRGGAATSQPVSETD